MVSACSSSVESPSEVAVTDPAKTSLHEKALPTALPNGLAGLDVQQLAAEGYFQAIAYWLNERLVPQNVYAQVLADQRPGRVKVLVEFERPPQPRRLLKFVCDHIYRLNSNVIEGVYLIAREVGTAKTEWEQRIRIPTAHQRQLKSRTKSQSNDQLKISESTDNEAKPAKIHTEKREPTKLVYESSRSQIAREVVRSQFKFFRAALISGSATVAFLFGGLTELILSERLGAPATAEPVTTAVPWYEEAIGDDATAVSFHAPERTGRTVEAALETVAVIPHQEVAEPDDPTITLLFGGELGLNDFIFEEAESLDRLFSDLHIYQQADVAMMGLSEPLATASTSLQENFYHRTRPQAVKALKTGGIDIVNLASEGTLTYGARGLDETLVTLDRQGIYRVGAGRNQQEAHRPEILEVKGQRIAYLGYNPEAVKAAKDDKAGVAHTNSKERAHIIEDIQAIRSQVDWVVVNYRWGDVLGNGQAESKKPDVYDDVQLNEFAAIPEAWQQSLARDAVDAGADLVVGYHPSQIQGAEIYRDRAIAYSLGDFVFGEAPLEDHDTAALRVSLRNRQMKVEFLPVSIRNSQIQMATGDHGTAILQSIRNASKTFDQPLRFPVVLKAPLTHTPQPDQLPSLPAIPNSGQFIDQTSPTFIEPIPAELVPDEDLFPEPTPELYEEASPHPTMRESEALFPVKKPSSEPSSSEPSPSESSSLESSSLDSSNLGTPKNSNELNELEAMPVVSDAEKSIEADEEPLLGPLSALPNHSAPAQNQPSQ
ncbi:MAG: CapA family protein [Cyanobacteria bacterium P01_C01_bin.121]